MLKTHGSLQQRSFFDSLIEDALHSDVVLSRVDAVLKELPHLLDSFVASYDDDRKARGINTSFGRPTIPVESILRLILLKHLHKNCTLRDIEKRTTTDYAWKGFAKLSLTDKVPDHTALNKWELFFGEQSIQKLHSQIIRSSKERNFARIALLLLPISTIPQILHC